MSDNDGMKMSPDPVAQAKAYQQSLLAALGDEPADAQSQAPANIRRMIEDAGDLLWTRPAPGG